MTVLSDFGMQPTGFIKPGLADIKTALETQYRAIYGTPNVQAGSRIGTRIGIMSKLLADSWEGLQGAYNAPFPSKGDDTSFADVVDLVGLNMLPAAAAQVTCQLISTGSLQVTVPAGTRISDPSGNVFSLLETVVIFQISHTAEGVFRAGETGPITVPENTTWTIVDAVTNWSTCHNENPGVTGCNAETPAEGRLRRSRSLKVIGAASVDSIAAHILNNVPNVTNCRGFENKNDAADAQGRPGHSMEFMVTNGADQDIANMLWAWTSGGIKLTGNTSSVVVDSQGNNQTVYFTRPDPVDMAVEVTITRYTEEELPANYEALIKAAVAAYAASFLIGKDMLIDRWLGPVYAACSGLDKITIKQAIDGGGWQTDDIAVPYNQYPGTVTVTVVGPV
jgi:uncharacterized phage protein gp47/JayE